MPVILPGRLRRLTRQQAMSHHPDFIEALGPVRRFQVFTNTEADIIDAQIREINRDSHYRRRMKKYASYAQSRKHIWDKEDRSYFWREVRRAESRNKAACLRRSRNPAG